MCVGFLRLHKRLLPLLLARRASESSPAWSAAEGGVGMRLELEPFMGD